MISVLTNLLKEKTSPFPHAKAFLGHCPTQLTPCSRIVLEKNLNKLIAEKVATSRLRDKDPEVIQAMMVRDELKHCVSKGKKYFPQKQTTIKQQVKSTLKNFFFSD